PVLRDEFVVLSAHYDHVGIDPTLDGDQIFNGADDDGSGTIALLEIAEAFQTAREQGYGPRRSIMFLSVSAEEKGLLGSRYYADVEPLVPLENKVANLNLDMIGRHDPTYPGETTDYVYIIGGDLISEDIQSVNERANDILQIELDLSDRFNAIDDPNQFYRRSDHWNFGKHNIPFIFYFTGTHEDYHAVSDTADKIDYPRMERIARLIYGATWQLANQDDRPQLSGQGFN
ncbi:MAG: M28 family peptidase, partial [Bacteroidota bacterium]